MALTLVAVGCTSGHAARLRAAMRAPTPSTTSPATRAAKVFPLTGVLVTDPNLLDRPAIAIKIDNEMAARPQAGLDVADVVYEEIVEGGDTRFLALFQSTDASLVGPVRSVRPTDPLLVGPVGGLFAYSGGTAKFVRLLHQAPVVDVGAEAFGSLYRERRDRRADHSLYTSTSRIYGARAGVVMGPPPPLFVFAGTGETSAADGASIRQLAVVVGAQNLRYTWDASTATWLRSINGSPHRVEGGAQLAPTNVIVQFTPYDISPGDFDTLHAPVSVARLVGGGDAWVLSGGRLVKGRWIKVAPTAVTLYTDAAGRPVPLAPGRTWVELAAVGAPAQAS